MTDIVERLRSGAEHKTLVTTGLVNQAADEIERLRAALREIANCKTFTDRQYMIDIARAALKEDGERGMVWCRKCGRFERVNAAGCLAKGWPQCCGYTMTIDSPEERVAPTALKEDGE